MSHPTAIARKSRFLLLFFLALYGVLWYNIKIVERDITQKRSVWRVYMKKFFIVDGNSIMNRAFYGIRLLTNKEGLYTNAIYGFLNIFFKNMDELKPDYVAVAFDLKEPTFRHKAYELYKAQRKKMPEELAVQMPVIKDILRAMNVRVLELPGYEADDIIGTVAKRCSDSAVECDILTGDKDDLQLASETTKIYLTVTSKGVTETKVYDDAAVLEKYGVTPHEFIDVKALMGDASDNIPGVAGIGEKTALSLIAQFKSIDEMYAGIEAAKIGPAAKKKLIEGRESAYLSRSLATIDVQSPLKEEIADCEAMPWDEAKLRELFTRLEFKSFLKRLTSESEEEEPALRIEKEKIAELTKGLESFYYYIFKDKDGEYTATAFLSGGRAYFTDADIAEFRGIFENSAVEKISHGIKEDMVLLSRHGIGYNNYGFDTAVAAYVVDPTLSDYKISKIALTYIEKDIKDTDAYKKGESILSDTDALKIAASTVKAVFELTDVLKKTIAENNQGHLMSDIELPLLSVLADMQIDGFKVDPDMLRDYGKELDLRIEGLSEAITFMAGEEFNINSPKQLGTVLFEHMGIPAVKKTKSGYSTDADVLSSLSGKYEIVDAVIEYRQLTKLKGTYIDGMLPLIAADGKIHSTFNQTSTATGRISSNDPNLQNIPVRMEEGRKLRKMFTAENENRVLVDADYSQIELRVLAHMSGDEGMIGAFINNTDIHKKTASEVFGVPEEAVTDSMRRRAKAVNFGIVYGISEFGLAKDIGITRNEAKRYIDAYFESYPKVKAYLDGVVEAAKKNGFVTTLNGRRRPIPELASQNYNMRSFGERAAMNTPVQGSAADIIKLAMIRVKNALKTETDSARLILQVHDELIVSCDKAEEDKVKIILEREMEAAAKLSVPLVAEAKSGYTWYDAK